MRPRKDLEGVVKAAFKNRRYVPNVAFRASAERGGAVLSPGAARNLVIDLQRSGLMRPAGRGWSSISRAAQFDCHNPLGELVKQLGEWFPFAESTCWSTHQLVGFFHHLPGAFYSYVYIDRSAMELLRDRLEEFYTNAKVFVNPSGTSFMHSHKATENFIVRPITKDDEIGTAMMLPIEGILVDFASEAELIIDGWDYGEIVRSIISAFTIDAHAILRRISRRRFTSRNTILLCDALFAEGIKNDSVREFYSQLKRKFS